VRQGPAPCIQRAALALRFAYYNFCGVHSSLRVTPAMEAEAFDHVLKELIGAPNA
jgi:hypothetical protein